MKKKLIKTDIVSMVCRDTGRSRSTVQLIIDSTLNTIIECMSGKGVDIQFANFGTFEVKERAPRTGRNPHTNEPVSIPAKIAPVFKPSSTFKLAVKNLER